MNNSPIFHKSLFDSTASKINVDLWDNCTDAFDAKEYLKSFHLFLDYVNGELRPKYGNAEGTKFKIPHGSIVVEIEIKDEMLYISAPFLEVNQSTVVPLLRQVCALNFNNMNLAQIYLKKEKELHFEYSCKLSQTNPYKMYYTLKEICATGDQYDDEYVTKFGAKRLHEPIVTHFTANKAETAYGIVQKMIKDAFEYVEFLESKRWYSLAWDVVALTLRQIDFYVQPQDQLRNDLARAIGDMHSKNTTINELTERGKKFLKYLQEMDQSQFISNLYEIETFIPDKRRASLQSIQENLEEEQKRTKENMSKGNYINIVLGIFYMYYNTFYYNNIPDNISRVMTDAMELASDKPWEDAAQILADSLEKIMKGDLFTAKKSSGFFSRLFSK